MRKILVLLLIAVSVNALGQGKTMYSVSWVKPKIGMNTAFENAWKAHVAKFHNGDDKRYVFEILTGDNAGSYQFVEGPMSYADMDMEKTGMAAHDADYEKTVAPTLASESGVYYYQYVDSLSYHSDVMGDKSVTTITYIKSGKMVDYRDELRKTIAVSNKPDVPFNSSRYVQMFAGSNPVMVSIYTLKDGFKQLEMDYFKNVPVLRDKYIAMYGFNAWTKRIALMDDITLKSETYLSKRRADLSSK